MSLKSKCILCLLAVLIMCVPGGCKDSNSHDLSTAGSSITQSSVSLTEEISQPGDPAGIEESSGLQEIGGKESETQSSTKEDSSRDESSEISAGSEEGSSYSAGSETEDSEIAEGLRLDPEAHYYGTEEINGITLNYELHLSSPNLISVSTPIENGGTIDYSLYNVSYSDGVYSYFDGTKSEYVPGTPRVLVQSKNIKGTIKVIDADTIEWNNDGGNMIRSFNIILRKK